MKRLLLLGAIIWTYGTEPLDYMIQHTDADKFMEALQCKVIESHVWCQLDDDSWHTIPNEPISIPWGIS